MTDFSNSKNAPYSTQYFPQHVALLTVGENLMPIGHWTVISKEPFRLLLAMELGNYSYELLKKNGKAGFHFFPWKDRYKIIRAGYISGRDFNKAQELGFKFLPADKLEHTKLVEGADAVFEMVVNRQIEGISREFAIYVFDIVATHGNVQPVEHQPIFYLSLKDFTTSGELWRYQK